MIVVEFLLFISYPTRETDSMTLVQNDTSGVGAVFRIEIPLTVD